MHITFADDHLLAHKNAVALQKRGFSPTAMPAGVQDVRPSIDAMLPDPATQLVLIDLTLPGMEGAPAIRAMRNSHPGRRIIVLANTDNRVVVLECLSAGAHGYVMKTGSADQLFTAIRIVMAGGLYVTAQLSTLPPDDAAEGRATDGRGPDAPGARAIGQTTRQADLTMRQRDVLELLAKGQRIKTIARNLGLGVGTVKAHLSGVYRALGVHTRKAAVARFENMTPGPTGSPSSLSIASPSGMEALHQAPRD